MEATVERNRTAKEFILDTGSPVSIMPTENKLKQTTIQY